METITKSQKIMLTLKDEIKNWLDEHKIENYTINADLTIDIGGNVYLHSRNLKKLPYQFGIVNGFFDCINNELTSLEHCPKTVDGHFYCYDNPLNSIKELFDIQVKGNIVIPERLTDSNEWKLLQKVRKLC